MREPVVHISKDILRLIAEIDEFKGQWHAIGKLTPERLDALKHVATIESVGSSTRIEGVRLTDQEIEVLLAGLDVNSFRSRDEEEVAGYAEVMNVVFASYNEIEITENYIKQLHSILLKYSSKDARHCGDYKKLPNNVEAFDPEGKSLGVIFETATPFETPAKMAALTEWLRRNLESKDQHPLLTIAIFVVYFLAIHPFQDGNGRLSRVFTTLLMLRCGYAYVPYGSLESIIEQNREGYYRALRTTQKTLDTYDADLETWIIFFLRCLKKQKDALTRKVEEEQAMIKLPELSERILVIVKEHGRVRMSDLEALSKANRNTLKVRVRELVADGLLQQHGKGKGTSYTT